MRGDLVQILLAHNSELRTQGMLSSRAFVYKQVVTWDLRYKETSYWVSENPDTDKELPVTIINEGISRRNSKDLPTTSSY